MPSPIRTALIAALIASAWLGRPASAIVPTPVYRSGGAGNTAAGHTPPAQVPAPAPQFETLMAFGAGAVALMLLCWGHERRIPCAALGTAAGALAASVYGFAQGAWPLGIAMAGFAVVAARRWWTSRRPRRMRRKRPTEIWLADGPELPDHPAPEPWQEESRVTRLFGRL